MSESSSFALARKNHAKAEATSSLRARKLFKQTLRVPGFASVLRPHNWGLENSGDQALCPLGVFSVLLSQAFRQYLFFNGNTKRVGN
jgi:hypothetical protein